MISEFIAALYLISTMPNFLLIGILSKLGILHTEPVEHGLALGSGRFMLFSCWAYDAPPEGIREGMNECVDKAEKAMAADNAANNNNDWSK